MAPTANKIFGTDGVRGRANVEPVTAETALKLGRAAAHVFRDLNPESRSRQRHQIVIGKDTRLSGYMLENALSSGILSMGVDVLFIGPLPTPGVARITNSLRADAGIVISASHNPYELQLATVHAPAGCAGAPLCMGDAVDECRFETPDGVDLTTSYEAYYIRKAEHFRMRWAPPLLRA